MTCLKSRRTASTAEPSSSGTSARSASIARRAWSRSRSSGASAEAEGGDGVERLDEQVGDLQLLQLRLELLHQPLVGGTAHAGCQSSKRFPSRSFGPTEAAELHLFDALVDDDTGGAELLQHRVEVAHPEVDHQSLSARPEVLRVGGEGRPDGLIAGSRREGCSVVLHRDPQMLRVPGAQRLGVARAEKDPADPLNLLSHATRPSLTVRNGGPLDELPLGKLRAVGLSSSDALPRPAHQLRKDVARDPTSARRAYWRSRRSPGGQRGYRRSADLPRDGSTQSISVSIRARAGTTSPRSKSISSPAEPVADRPPEVLLDQPVRKVRERLTVVEGTRKSGGERVDQRGDRLGALRGPAARRRSAPRRSGRRGAAARSTRSVCARRSKRLHTGRRMYSS